MIIILFISITTIILSFIFHKKHKELFITVALCLLSICLIQLNNCFNSGPYDIVLLANDSNKNYVEYAKSLNRRLYKYKDKYFIIKENQEEKILWIPFYKVEFEEINLGGIIHDNNF